MARFHRLTTPTGQADLRYCLIETPLGPLLLTGRSGTIEGLCFTDYAGWEKELEESTLDESAFGKARPSLWLTKSWVLVLVGSPLGWYSRPPLEN